MQHQTYIYNSTAYFVSYGVEPYLPFFFHPILMTVHFIVMFQNMIILPPQFYYRLKIIANPSTSVKHFLWNMLFAVSLSSFLSIFLAVAMVSTMKKGASFYMEQFDPTWHSPSDGGVFIYMITLYNPYTIAFVPVCVILLTACHLVEFYYVILNYLQANVKSRFVTDKTKSLQRQFTRNLIAQTGTAMVCGTFPLLLLLASIVLGFNFKFTGAFITTPLSWHPTLNATLSLVLVTPYRRTLMERLSCGKCKAYGNQKSTQVSIITGTASIIPR
ncbi:unnamed protein product [Bursaphelenchus xylophilus]|uniref:(pine wood nematode) hypothetical protein n=1 Tax=Bursaphelenchus xylophilus TaxID=6326 RepID=A0A1I7S066_BURXY|nr:unnamed protein product [Bursaphelenchus xylophilus]CAG9108982.1 unnamed protein product [Bursaphelenchus xylophilus]